jgi:putative permease
MRTGPAGGEESAGRGWTAEAVFAALARSLLLLAGIAVLFWFLLRIQRVLLLFAMVAIFAIAINAPVTTLERRGWSRGGALAAVSLGLLALVAGALWLLVPRLAGEIPGLLEQVAAIAQQLADTVGERFGMREELERQVEQMVAWATGAAQQMWRFADSLLAGVVTVIVATALVLYLVANPRPLLEATLRAMPPHLRARTAHALARGSRMVVAWVAANAIMGVIKAVAAFLFLTAMGVPGAAIWSVLTFFSALVPQVGFYLMSIPPVVMAFAQDPMTALWVGLYFWALSTFLGNFVAPRIQGERMQLHPAYILAMTVAFGYGFGVVGVIVAAPVAGFLKAFFDAFYLEHQPPDPRSEERVEAILERNPEALA